ncbi:MAG: dihydropteroate synthase [Acidobacteria bacterium]|nr:MAG: dihydropteroate synthase [Acidobacteriota bacterium]
MISPRRHFTVPLPDGRALNLGERTLVMGILNITPDSFAGGPPSEARMDSARAIADARQMVRDGADMLDIGGESTRPGAPTVGAEEEWRRVRPVLEGLRGQVDVPISIDTYKASIADQAIALGATIVNDISGFTYDPDLPGVVARTGAAAILMHNRGRSADIYEFANYTDVMGEIARELAARVSAAEAAGVSRERLIIDPGYGFAKRAGHTLEALARLDELAAVGRPILSGPSRKSFLKTPLGDVPPAARLWGTAAAVTASILAGAHIVRVHDVAEMSQVARTADAIRNVK